MQQTCHLEHHAAETNEWMNKQPFPDGTCNVSCYMFLLTEIFSLILVVSYLLHPYQEIVFLAKALHLELTNQRLYGKFRLYKLIYMHVLK